MAACGNDESRRIRCPGRACADARAHDGRPFRGVELKNECERGTTNGAMAKTEPVRAAPIRRCASRYKRRLICVGCLQRQVLARAAARGTEPESAPAGDGFIFGLTAASCGNSY